jgi:peptidyl-dipeptidase Dcp
MSGQIKFKSTAIVCIVTLLLAISCTSNKTEVMESGNILLEEWSGPYGGVPAFDKMDLADVKPALEKGMELNLAEIDAIADNPEPPTFENTIVALQRAGQVLDRVYEYYGILSSNVSSPEFRVIETEMAPKLSEFSSKISQNKKLFDRIKAVYEASLESPLEPDQQRVVQLIYDGFAMNGAELEGADKERYAAINKELSRLYTKFSNNILADEEDYVTYLNEDQLSGLSEPFINAAAETAKNNGREGKYAIANTRSVVEPFLTFSDERAIREQVWKTFKSRGDNGDDKDNKEIIAQILQLRDERVGLLGFDNYAAWRLQDRMAKTPENAFDLMMAIWPAAVSRVAEEVADMQQVADQLGDNITIEPWDYLYYAEKVRKDKYDLDSETVKQYLQLDNLREAMFFVAGEIFNFNFSPVPEGTVPVFNDDVKVWEVTNKDSGKLIGIFYLDPYARKGKRSGAWATTYRSYTNFDGEKIVLASNNSNFIKPAPGEPLLISWTDAETLFHEFGHAMHFLAANVRYPALNNGVRDYTEFQSQLLERWLSTDEVINNYLVNYQTGDPMPKELVEKIKLASTFNQGYETTEYLSSALVDMKLHTLDDPTGIDVAAFERETLEELNMPKEIAMRHRTPQFGHVFSGEGYAAAYYGYIWADVLTADAAEMFAEAPGGFYDKNVAEKLVEFMYAPRNSMDPSEAFLLFRGREANFDALMRDRGFPVN